VGKHLLVAYPDSQEDVPAPDDRLVGVVGTKVQAAPNENAGQNVSRRGNSLPGFAAYGKSKIVLT
jgi:hypothetical protein